MPPQREQKTNGGSPIAVLSRWPLSAKTLAAATTLFPLQVSLSLCCGSFARLLHDQQFAHRQLSSSVRSQKCRPRLLASSLVLGARSLFILPSADGNSGSAVAMALATNLNLLV